MVQTVYCAVRTDSLYKADCFVFKRLNIYVISRFYQQSMNTSSYVGCKISKETYRKLRTGLEVPIGIIFRLISWLRSLELILVDDLLWNLLVFLSERNMSRHLSTSSKNDGIYSL